MSPKGSSPGVTILRDVVKLSSWHSHCHLGVRAAVTTHYYHFCLGGMRKGNQTFPPPIPATHFLLFAPSYTSPCSSCTRFREVVERTYVVRRRWKVVWGRRLQRCSFSESSLMLGWGFLMMQLLVSHPCSWKNWNKFTHPPN